MTDNPVTFVIAATGDAIQLANGSPFVTWADVVARERSRDKATQMLIETGPSLSLRIEVDDGRPVLASLSVKRESGGPSLTSSAVHDLRVDALLDEAVAAVAGAVYSGLIPGLRGPGSGAAHWDPFEYDSARSRAQIARRRRPMTDALLQQVASIARANPLQPREQVALQIPTSTRTASRWIAEARQRGFLNDEGSNQ